MEQSSGDLKKRGRRPKIKLDDELGEVVESVVSDVVEQQQQPSSPVIGRRGRKPKDKFKFDNNNIEEYQKLCSDENVIIKLPLNCMKLCEELNIGSDLYPYNPTLTVPKPFNQEDINNGISIHYSVLDGVQLEDEEIHQQQQQPAQIVAPSESMQKVCYCNGQPPPPQAKTRQIDIILNNKYNSNTEKINVLTQLGVTSTDGSNWISSTSIACFWDCHQFEGVPWGIPIKYQNGKYHLFGIFCSPNCALAHLLLMSKNDEILWDRISLLNMLCFHVYGVYDNLMPSPDKIALKLFGGSMSIEEYRGLIAKNKHSYTLEFPPCNSVIPVLEEIYKKTNLTNTFVPIETNKVSKVGNELKLKRSKPINSRNNTIEALIVNY